MKKFLCILLCVLLFAGCEKSSKDAEDEIPDFYGFRTDVKTTVNNVSISANAEYTELYGLVLTFTSPESVKGMKIKIKDDECEILYHSLSFVIPISALSFKSLCVSLDACAKGVKTAVFENNYYTYSYGGNTYHLYIDDATKKFNRITVDENEILTFENFQFLTGQTD